MRLYSLIVCTMSFALPSTTILAADVWIFSGQSNMQKISSSAQRAVGNVVANHKRDYLPIYSAAPGKPIEAWLDSKHKDHKLWLSIVEKVEQAKNDGHQFKGFTWYQGESNVNSNAGNYQDQLAELVKRIRKLTGEPALAVVVVQIGAATSYSGKDWAVATIREAQRRFARDDPDTEVVTAIDAEIGDYTVHLSRRGADLVSSRIAAAADRLAYGNQKAHWGPKFKSAYFATKTRREVVIEFDDVFKKLKLGEGWMAGFGASIKTSLPDPLSRLEDAEQLGQLSDDFIDPSSGGQLDARRIILVFDQPLPADTRISYAATRNAQYGPHRRWGLEFGGVQDESEHHTPAFALVPIAKSKETRSVSEGRATKDNPSLTLRVSKLRRDWQQVAVNCVGRFPDAVTSPQAEAGIDQDGWRQTHWNPASAGLAPNLFGKAGDVTPISFHTGVWYMSPYFRELKNADDTLMTSWCKNKLHAFHGLQPQAKYDLLIYLLQGPPRKKVDNPPDHRAVRISILDIPMGKKRKDGRVVTEQTAQVPADGKFAGYKMATTTKNSPGNVVKFTSVAADEHGRIQFVVETSELKGERIRWGETTLAGVQIRKISR